MIFLHFSRELKCLIRHTPLINLIVLEAMRHASRPERCFMSFTAVEVDLSLEANCPVDPYSYSLAVYPKQ